MRAQFADLVDRRRGPDGCWPFTGGRFPAGYGRFSLTPRSVQMGAHRAAYEYAFGPVPPGLLVCHRCDNPPCCNPAHLFAGTGAANTADMDSKGRANRPRWSREGHPRAKVSEADVSEIRRRYAAGEPLKHISRDFPIGETQTHRIAKSESWA